MRQKCSFKCTLKITNLGNLQLFVAYVTRGSQIVPENGFAQIIIIFVMAAGRCFSERIEFDAAASVWKDVSRPAKATRSPSDALLGARAKALWSKLATKRKNLSSPQLFWAPLLSPRESHFQKNLWLCATLWFLTLRQPLSTTTNCRNYLISELVLVFRF
jgi:hypothetical protein